MSAVAGFEVVSKSPQEIPKWAPVVSVDASLSSVFKQFDLDYLELGKLVKDEGGFKDDLKGLWTHFADKKWDEPYPGGIPFAATYISKALAEKPMFRNYLQSKIPQISEQNLSDHRFIIVNVPSVIQEAGLADADPMVYLRGFFAHELVHFIEDMRGNGDQKRAELKKGPELGKNALEDFNNAEERYVRYREEKIMQADLYSGLLTAALK
jgi:hypothetical protein